MVLKSLKIRSFLQFFADFTKESKAVITISVDASESSRFVFFWKMIFFMLLCYDLEFRGY